MDYDAYDAILQHIYAEIQGDSWFKPGEETAAAGVCLRASPGSFRVFPYENELLVPFEAAARALNPIVAIKVVSATVYAALNTVHEDATAIYVDVDTRIQILDFMVDLPRGDKEQCAAFIRDERALVIWADNLDHIIPTYRDFKDRLVKLVWLKRSPVASSFLMSGSVGTVLDSISSSTSETGIKVEAAENSEPPSQRTKPIKNERNCLSFLSWRATENQDKGRVMGGSEDGRPQPRPRMLYGPFYGGVALALSISYCGNGLNLIVQEYLADHDATRFAFIVTFPFLLCVSLFFSYTIVGTISFLIGPVAQFHENSVYYSAVKPVPNKAVDENLPHVTIQMPVYKESLKETIMPTVESLKRAMQTYSRQGGTSSIFVNDDGLQLVSQEDREARIAFYADHGIGFVARPPHDAREGGFKRAGRFKKASNMNYALTLSLKLEHNLVKLEDEMDREEFCRFPDDRDYAQDEYGNFFTEEEELEERALRMAIDETYAETENRFMPWAANARAIRIGEIILIVDSDTVVPEDCLRDAARELAECPEVGIIQHYSDVMQVAWHYFENGIAHFTRKINRAISVVCANGEVAPFVGHNAFLRWSALQDAAFIDPADGRKKIWSEANVSEDFDMALRLMLKGYIIRWATYSNGGFKEGVSLTADDELNRWQKYAYGCNELLFNPLVDWWKKGPINPQLNVFVWGRAPLHYKISMLSYMFSYYAIAAGAALSLMNYLLLGFGVDIDGFYMHSYEIWIACMVVFPLAGNLMGFTILEYRLGTRSFFSALYENILWIPFFAVFFGGLSIHLSQALLAHLFSYNITWGATKKEVERSNFFLEVPKILRRFWIALIISVLLIATMVVLSLERISMAWRIPVDQALLVPLGLVAAFHILFPIVLNPWLMIFSY